MIPSSPSKSTKLQEFETGIELRLVRVLDWRFGNATATYTF